MKRLTALRKQLGYSQKEFAQKIGVPSNTYNQWERGKRQPDIQTIIDLAKLFNVSVDYLIGREDLKLLSENPATVRIPVYGNIAAGIPIEAIVDYDLDNADDWEEISEEMSRNGTHIALRIKGNSMEPRMKTGDVVIIRVQQDVDDGDIAAVRINGDDVTCKKIKKTEDGLLLLSINSDYDPLLFTPDQIESLPVVIIGKVVELRAKF